MPKQEDDRGLVRYDVKAGSKIDAGDVSFRIVKTKGGKSTVEIVFPRATPPVVSQPENA
jgi:predicted deacylase